MKRGKKAQLTIFIIIAILIVAVVLFIFLFWPKLNPSVTESENPYNYMETCIENRLEEVIDTIISQGGTYNLDEDITFFYEEENIRFLCHTNAYYQQTCYRQVAFLLTSIESEIRENIEAEVEQCFERMKESYENKGYEVIYRYPEDFKFIIVPNELLINFGRDLILTKGGDDVQEYRNFALSQRSGLYEIIRVAESIISLEQETGYVDLTAYRYLYPDITFLMQKVENSEYDNVKIYFLTDRNTKEEFKFAIRSLAYPPVPDF
jgi:hypothetical protein